MKKKEKELVARVAALEAQVAALSAQLARQAVYYYPQPYPNQWPTITFDAIPASSGGTGRLTIKESA